MPETHTYYKKAFERKLKRNGYASGNTPSSDITLYTLYTLGEGVKTVYIYWGTSQGNDYPFTQVQVYFAINNDNEKFPKDFFETFIGNWVNADKRFSVSDDSDIDNNVVIITVDIPVKDLNLPCNWDSLHAVEYASILYDNILDYIALILHDVDVSITDALHQIKSLDPYEAELAMADEALYDEAGRRALDAFNRNPTMREFGVNVEGTYYKFKVGDRDYETGEVTDVDYIPE